MRKRRATPNRCRRIHQRRLAYRRVLAELAELGGSCERPSQGSPELVACEIPIEWLRKATRVGPWVVGPDGLPTRRIESLRKGR